MARAFLPILLLFFGAAAAAPQDGQAAGYASGRHIPILYEAYYPEPREWNPQASLREIQKLRDLTSQLLREEEQLSRLAASAAANAPENVFEPRGQVLEYVFSGPAPPVAKTDADDVQVASITVSDSGPHRTRHHHGKADWLLRRLAAAKR